ncbi:hypothetical protein KR100_02650 [Synechococcus sp. KORDI-100]|uniref:DUF3769 domain-containing protein n=1 Tax=Synechococcus sp. KORDI-100 TaxID=1280380 RepID=UPI0004E05D64|nr:DUF3769 domain-containing protein [Synechococcus sp. KORDI-100]AII42300.1 hypothetical protein KR100_02650 [Synechococcus sp. KORDI-100]
MKYAGWFLAGITSIGCLPMAAEPLEVEPDSVEQPAGAPQPPGNVQLEADRQFYDQRRGVTIAEGNVRVVFGNAVLRADRIEFDSGFRSLFARGSVRLKRGKQYFQASAFRYNLFQNEGELDDVYGVVDLESLSGNFLQSTVQTMDQDDLDQDDLDQEVLNEEVLNDGDLEVDGQADDNRESTDSALASRLRSDLPADEDVNQGMACPPELPAPPDWNPEPWALTAWGGQSIDSNFGDTFLFNGRMRPEYLLGLGLQKRILRAGPLSLELEADLFGHKAGRQPGGEFNQTTPFQDLPAQTFGEGILGIGARVWVQPWLNFGFIEGISYNTDYSLYEKTFRENYTQLLNYLGFEVEAAVSSDLSLVGRIHHRSGAFGTYGGVTEGSNAYLLGLRYRWGEEAAEPESAVMPPPLGCPDPDRGDRVQPTSLSDRLEDVALGDGGQPRSPAFPEQQPAQPGVDPAVQQALRTQAIAEIDQRVSDVTFQGTLKLERRSGVPLMRINSNVRDENRFGVVRVPELKRLGGTQLIDGTISRWRIQASRVRITPEGWTADRMGFTNDPFTPAQTRIDAEGVIAREQPNGAILITARRNRLLVEDRLPVPVSRRQLIDQEEEIENRWVLGIDNKDRDGLFVGRNLRPIELGSDTELTVQPQLLIQRAIDGKGDGVGDLLGLEAQLLGRYGDYRLKANADISTFHPSNFINGSRYWGSFGRNLNIGGLGLLKTELFGTYRYRSWNGSLGETDIDAAYGLYGEQRGEWMQGESSHRYLVRGAFGDYYAERYSSNRMLRAGRGSLFGSLTSRFPLVSGETAELSPQAAYRYTPEPIVPGITLNTNINSTLAVYGTGDYQKSLSFSGGPTLTLGTFSKPFMDFTQFTVIGGGTLLGGASPFEFDRVVDFGTLGLGITQQIAGPLVISTGVKLNVDPGSQYYGDVMNSNIEFRWQRRSYDIGVYFNPYEGIGGVRFRLNDFDFDGTGVPFVPYNPMRVDDRNDGLPL